MIVRMCTVFGNAQVHSSFASSTTCTVNPDSLELDTMRGKKQWDLTVGFFFLHLHELLPFQYDCDAPKYSRFKRVLLSICPYPSLQCFPQAPHGPFIRK